VNGYIILVEISTRNFQTLPSFHYRRGPLELPKNYAQWTPQRAATIPGLNNKSGTIANT